MATNLRPEGDDRSGDELSFGTLTYSLDPLPQDMPPSGLTAVLSGGRVLLSWWGSANAMSYRVKRGTSASGPFEMLATVIDPRTYQDSAAGGTLYYVVTAITNGGETGASNVVRVVVPGELRLFLPFDEGSGTTAADMSGLGRSAVLVDGASWAPGRNGGSALSLDGVSAYVALAEDILEDVGDFTIAVWVLWAESSTNTRVFDFGTSDMAYMTFIPKDGKGVTRFALSGTTFYGDQSIVAKAPLPVGQWVHVAVTLSGTTGTLYINGSVAGTNDAITFAPFQIGKTTQNWLGRSQFATDPRFKGSIADLRLYTGALGAADVQALAR